MLEDLCFAFWGGGMGNHKLEDLRGVINLLKKEHIKYKDIPDTREARVLILNDLLLDVPTVHPSREYFFQFANEQLGGKSGLTRTKQVREYRELVKKQEEVSRQHYESAKRLLDRELPNDVQYWVVAGPHDTNTIVPVFEDRVLHAPHMKSFGPWNFMGIPALDHHDPNIAYDSQVRSEAPRGKPTAEEEFLAGKEARKAHVIVSNDLLKGYFAKELNSYIPGRHGDALNSFVHRQWIKEQPRLRKLLITPADHIGHDSHIAPIPAGRVLNLGAQSNKHGVYFVRLNSNGFFDETSIYLDGRIGPTHAVSGQTYTAHDTRNFGSPEEHKVATRYAQTTVCKDTEKLKNAFRKAKKPKQLGPLAEHSKGLETVLKQNDSRGRNLRNQREENKDLQKENRAQKRQIGYLQKRFSYIGDDLMAEEHDREALNVYQKALEEVPERDKRTRGLIMHNMGAAYENLDRLPAALQHYESALQLQPRNKTISTSYNRCQKKIAKK